MMKGKKKHEARIENSGHLLLTALLRVLIFVIIAVILFALGFNGGLCRSW